MAGGTGNGGRIYLQAGDVIRLRLPYSEVCMSMQVAGRAMNVQVVGDGVSVGAQLLNDDGTRFSFPILLGEAGIFTDDSGRHYVPARRAIVTRLRLLVTFDAASETGRGWYEMTLGVAWAPSYIALTTHALRRLHPKVSIVGWERDGPSRDVGLC